MKLLHFILFAVAAASSVVAADKVGPFMEPDFPFYQTQVDLKQASGPLAESFVTRGIVVQLGARHALAFDQDLLRVAGIWEVPANKSAVTLENMAQGSYANPHRKSGAAHSKPTGRALLENGLRPGAGFSEEDVARDPRETNANGDLGRGPLPADRGRFEGVELAGRHAILTYRIEGTPIREWHEVAETETGTLILRHLDIGPQPKELFLSLGVGDWTIRGREAEYSKERRVAITARSNSAAVKFEAKEGSLIARLAPAARGQRVTLAFVPDGAPAGTALGPTPETPRPAKDRRWAEQIITEGKLGEVRANGLVLDRIALPEANPWQRRIRPADIAFLSADRAGVLTFDGDVWLVDGLADAALAKVTWKRFASGLHESLALLQVNGALQVATKNGLTRLHDRDGNGEADWYENFSDVVRQSQSTRSFPLDMDLAPDGSTYVSAGGISLGGLGTPFSGGIARISPDGRTAKLVSTGAREPYVTVHPRTGLLTSTDQQGQFVPSSVCYMVREGDAFGFGQERPAQLSPPLVWIPHTEDNSCASQVWLTGEKLGPFRDRLLHLSYGNGGLFLIALDLTAPTPQGAFIPLAFDTRMPLLQGCVHPDQSSVFLAGFQIYDSRAKEMWSLGRLRISGDPVTTAIDAQSCKDGVVLHFAAPLKAESVRPESVEAKSWNYQRTKNYGSGRFQRDGKPGMDVVGVSQAVLSADRKSVFIHLPELAPAMQLEVRHSFRLESGPAAEGAVYFTIHQPRVIDLAAAGFAKVDLQKRAIVSRAEIHGEPTAEMGRTLSVGMGCIACHSTDGTMEGKTGPTWKGMFGIDRQFTDESVESANEFYIRDSILEPAKKIVKGFAPGMASYKGVLSAAQIDALTLYIKSLK